MAILFKALFVFSCLVLLHTGESAPDTAPIAIGGNPCVWGPGHWCKEVANAQKCDAVKYCVDNKHFTETSPGVYVLSKTTVPDVPVLGAQKCTWGPAYWCANLANAKECDAMNHCLTKKWNGVAPSA